MEEDEEIKIVERVLSEQFPLPLSDSVKCAELRQAARVIVSELRIQRSETSDGNPDALLPLRSSVHWDPEYLAPSAWIEHVPFAYWVIDVFRPSRLVELGTLHGTSYLSFCQAIKALRVGTVAFAVDTWEGDQHAGILGSSSLAALRIAHDPLYSSFSTLMPTTFDTAAAQFEEESIDLLHIDGLHTYEAVRHDFETWLPKMRHRSIVMFHDTQVYERGFGVFKLWSELISSYPHFEFYHGNGLGVLGIGAGFPSSIQSLFDISGNVKTANTVRVEFAKIGQRVSALQRVSRLENDKVVKTYLQIRHSLGRLYRRVSSSA